MEDTKAEKKKCKAFVRLEDDGKITTHSCTTDSRLIDRGGCSDGYCDDYECPDCGHQFRIEWPD